VICDFGTGEATNYNLLLNYLSIELSKNINAYGMDISLSRIDVARSFSAIEAKSIIPNFFLGDLKNIPLTDNSVDCALTIHAIEPNGGSEAQILNELVRITRNFIILAEPAYETLTQQQERMRHFGYIKNLRTLLYANSQIEVLGECIVPEVICANPLNRTTLFIARKRLAVNISKNSECIYACPISNNQVTRRNGFWLSKEGSCYPEINGIPVLRSDFALPYFKQSSYLC